MINPAEAPAQPKEITPAAQETPDEPQEVTPDIQTETEQDPINYEVIIEDIENRTGRRYRLEQIGIVVETITGLQDDPARGLVMDVLEKIAEQLGTKLINFPDHFLPQLAKKTWQEMNGVKPAEKPSANTQAEDEPMRAGDTAGGPVEKWTGSMEASIDPSGGPSRNLGEPMDEITSQPNNTGKI